ncbi:MAG: SH3 domain-containing protein [Synergistaceae bacterium]|nr:SH3 domain-containing protein [Synergistaceae bacterium]
MRKILAVIAVFILCVSACEGRTRFVDFPTLGECTGSYVRYRAEPSTDSDIWGRLSMGDKVIVVGQTAVDGEVWYEILPKNAQESAYVFGKYIAPFFNEELQRSLLNKLIIDVLQTYCAYEDDDYWGEYDGEFDYPEIKRKYNSQGWLSRVELWNPSKDFGFGDIRIGDNVSKLRDILGEPDKESDSECVYMAGSYATFTFRVRDGKITRMIYEEE